MTIKEILTDYLSGPRDHYEGAELYRRYGVNLRLKKVFSSDDSETSHSMMIEELRQLAGLSEFEFRNLPRRAFRKAPDLSFSGLPESDKDGDKRVSDYPEATEAMRRMIRLREEFPFLNSPDCPDELKILVSDMFTALGSYKSAHGRLLEMAADSVAEASEECRVIIEDFLRNRAIWKELNHYKEHAAILGEYSVLRKPDSGEDISALGDMELMNRLRSAQANESKHKKLMNEASAKGEDAGRHEGSYRKWKARKIKLRAEMENRKKKHIPD